MVLRQRIEHHEQLLGTLLRQRREIARLKKQGGDTTAPPPVAGM